MPTLRELQLHFRASLHDEQAINARRQADELFPQAGLLIYRATIASNLISSLKITYPCLEKLLGAAFFLALCQSYLELYPSVSGDLNHYGAQMADFLGNFAPTQQLAYLPDVARLEWIYQEILHAAAPVKATLAALTELNTLQYQNVTFALNTTGKIINSNYPLKKIWEFCQLPQQPNSILDLNKPSHPLMIYRPRFSVALEELVPLEYELLLALISGARLGDVYAQFVDKAAADSVDAALRKFIDNNMLIVRGETCR